MWHCVYCISGNHFRITEANSAHVRDPLLLPDTPGSKDKLPAYGELLGWMKLTRWGGRGGFCISRVGGSTDKGKVDLGGTALPFSCASKRAKQQRVPPCKGMDVL